MSENLKKLIITEENVQTVVPEILDILKRAIPMYSPAYVEFKNDTGEHISTPITASVWTDEEWEIAEYYKYLSTFYSQYMNIPEAIRLLLCLQLNIETKDMVMWIPRKHWKWRKTRIQEDDLFNCEYFDEVKTSQNGNYHNYFRDNNNQLRTIKAKNAFLDAEYFIQFKQ